MASALPALDGTAAQRADFAGRYAVISQEARNEVRGRFDFRCGYSDVSESDIGARLTIDHFQPRARGGSHEPDNLDYCCLTCNTNKGEYWSPESSANLLQPHR